MSGNLVFALLLMTISVTNLRKPLLTVTALKRLGSSVTPNVVLHIAGLGSLEPTHLADEVSVRPLRFGRCLLGYVVEIMGINRFILLLELA